jgi:hypothetical protein
MPFSWFLHKSGEFDAFWNLWLCGESAFLVLEIAHFAGCLDLDMIRSILLLK